MSKLQCNFDCNTKVQQCQKTYNFRKQICTCTQTRISAEKAKAKTMASLAQKQCQTKIGKMRMQQQLRHGLSSIDIRVVLKPQWHIAAWDNNRSQRYEKSFNNICHVTPCHARTQPPTTHQPHPPTAEGSRCSSWRAGRQGVAFVCLFARFWLVISFPSWIYL